MALTVLAMVVVFIGDDLDGGGCGGDGGAGCRGDEGGGGGGVDEGDDGDGTGDEGDGHGGSWSPRIPRNHPSTSPTA